MSTDTERLGYNFVAVVVTAQTQLLILGNGVSQGLVVVFVFFFFPAAGRTHKKCLCCILGGLGTNIDREKLISRSSPGWFKDARVLTPFPWGTGSEAF